MQLDVAQLVLNVLCVFGAQFFDEKLKLTTLESFIRLLFVLIINKYVLNLIMQLLWRERDCECILPWDCKWAMFARLKIGCPIHVPLT